MLQSLNNCFITYYMFVARTWEGLILYC